MFSLCEMREYQMNTELVDVPNGVENITIGAYKNCGYRKIR